jgi:hypothetical protein
MVEVHPRAVLLVQLYYMMAVMQHGSVGVFQSLFRWALHSVDTDCVMVKGETRIVCIS